MAIGRAVGDTSGIAHRVATGHELFAIPRAALRGINQAVGGVQAHGLEEFHRVGGYYEPQIDST
jgi:hypothetical protein